MISLSELRTAFVSEGFTYHYGYTPNGTKLPYLSAVGNGSDNFVADSKVYEPKQGITLEFYSAKKDETNETRIEGVLNELGLIWEKSEAFDDDQTFYLTTYTFWR